VVANLTVNESPFGAKGVRFLYNPLINNNLHF
jgi:hypothetical protein